MTDVYRDVAFGPEFGSYDRDTYRRREGGRGGLPKKGRKEAEALTERKEEGSQGTLRPIWTRRFIRLKSNLWIYYLSIKWWINVGIYSLCERFFCLCTRIICLRMCVDCV